MSPRLPSAAQAEVKDDAQDGRGLFEFVCGELERRTNISRAVARGTVRLAMKEASLVEESLTKETLAVMVRHVLAPMLAKRNVAKADSACKMIAKVLEVSPATDFGHQHSVGPARRPSSAS